MSKYDDVVIGAFLAPLMLFLDTITVRLDLSLRLLETRHTFESLPGIWSLP